MFEYGNEYFRSEAIAKTGETWLGLFEKNGEYELRNTKVKLQLAFKAKDPDYEDSVRLNFEISNQPLFITRGSKSLTPSQVYTIYHRPSPEEVASRNLPLKQLSQGYIEQFGQLGKGYTLRVARGTITDGTKVNVLALETKDTQQILTYNLYRKDHNTLYNSLGDLLWVGDLDGDHKLDLYLSDFGFEKGGFGSKLFLSSEAEPGKVVKLAANFATSGC